MREFEEEDALTVAQLEEMVLVEVKNPSVI